MKKIEETFYSYATGNIYYTIQKNYNEVKSRKPLAVCNVSNFLKLNMQNTLHPPVFIGIQSEKMKGEGYFA